MRYAYIFVITSVFIIIGCAPHVDLDAEKTKVQAVVDNMEKALENNDLELLSSIISQSPKNVFMGTDLSEYWIGFDKFINAHKQVFTSVDKGSNISFNDLRIDISKSGDAAWVSGTMDWKGTAQGEPIDIKGVRLTLILQKEKTNWLIYHIHSSVPVSGQVLEY
jgi:uncharacterized protein (TIGR02246 family)